MRPGPLADAVHVQHPVLRPDTIGFRGYQANLARIASKHDTLVVLPTGLGKTVIALLAIADAIKDGATRILFMAPTKPLVEQHARFFEEVLAEGAAEVHCLTGNVAPDQRSRLYGRDGICCATPQVIQNDVVSGRLDASCFDWVVFDEAHRAQGEYPYTFLAERVKGAHRLGLTASPGHEARRIQEVMQNLGLPHAEIRTPQDPDVAPYVQETRVEWESLPLPKTMARVSRRLQDALADRVRFLKDGKWLASSRGRPSRRALLDCAHKLQAMARSRADLPPEVYTALSVQAQAMKLVHAIELAETQGSAPFRAFIDKLRKEAEGPSPSKATKSVLADRDVNEAYEIAKHDTQENPKLGRTEVLVRERLEADADSRVIVFANYRDTCESIARSLEDIDGVRAVVFVGQGRRKGREGLTQKQQQEILQRFRDGDHNVLVATSVAEEGLDIPATDLVVFYEPIPSEIRVIQRRGRTGRHGEGRVVVLMTKGTQDEAAHWSAQRKEQQMVQELQEIRRIVSGTTAPPVSAVPASQRRLEVKEREPEAPRISRDVKVVCDHREQAGGVVKHLHTLGLDVEVRPLDIGDFVLSDRVVVERKTAEDFVASLLDQRLFEQLKALQGYPKPILLLEGDGLVGHRNVSAEALHGALASITIDFGIPVIRTQDPLETARFLAAVAKREQKRAHRRLAVRPGSPGMDEDDRTKYVLAGFPRVDEVRAEALLRHFGSLAAVFEASEKALAEVPGVGPSTASSIHELLRRPYRDTETVSRRA